MLAWFAGCLIRAVPTESGILSWDAIKSHVKPVGPHSAPTRGPLRSRTPTTWRGGVFTRRQPSTKSATKRTPAAFPYTWMARGCF